MHLFTLTVPSWQVTGWTLPFLWNLIGYSFFLSVLFLPLSHWQQWSYMTVAICFVSVMTVIILVGFNIVMGFFILGLDSVLYFFWYLDMRTWCINIIIEYLGHEVMILNITYFVCKVCWKNRNSYLLCLLVYLQICVSLFERAFSQRCAEGCKMQTRGLQPLAEWCITSQT